VPSIGTVQVTLLGPDLVSKFTQNSKISQNLNTDHFSLDNVSQGSIDGVRDGVSLVVRKRTSGHVHGPLGWTWRQQVISWSIHVLTCDSAGFLVARLLINFVSGSHCDE
jgi:hypothetical protein